MIDSKITKGPRRLLLFVGVISVVLLAAACSSDDTATTTTAGAEATPALTLEAADFNGDGKVVIAVATDGSRDDGGYYQALVEKVESIARDAGFEAVIVVDLIDPANAATELENLAQQNTDIIAVGSSALGEPLPALIEKYPNIFWYCNCGSGYPDTPGLVHAVDRGAEIQMSGGYATGLLMQERGVDNVVMLGCCDLNFEVESVMGFEFGLKQVDESFTITYVPTGNFPFDFNNAAGATEAYFNAVAEGVDAVAPFLGSAADAVIRLANEDGLIVVSEGTSSACERGGANADLAVDIQVTYDAGDYFETIINEILSGATMETGAREFHVGIDPEVGAGFCDGTAEHIAALDVFNARVGAGEFADEIAAILSEAYGF